jgi:hypothetical protein
MKKEIREVVYVDRNGVHSIPVEKLIGADFAEVSLEPSGSLFIKGQVGDMPFSFEVTRKNTKEFGITVPLLAIRKYLSEIGEEHERTKGKKEG